MQLTAWLRHQKMTVPCDVYAMQAQQLSLNYHFNCEQRVCFATGTYFGFNGAPFLSSSFYIPPPISVVSAHPVACCASLLR